MVRYPHEQRFQIAGDLVVQAAPATFLDYGCGDGHFLVGLIERQILAPDARICALEPDLGMLELLRANLDSFQLGRRGRGDS